MQNNATDRFSFLSGELGSRLLFLLVAIIVYRIGTYIPIPGIDPERVIDALGSSNDGETSFGDLANLFSGGAIERMSIFALNLMPYISASIVIQLLSHLPGSLKELRAQGSSGRKKITQYTRYLTFVISFFQGIAFCIGMQSQVAIYQGPAFWLVGGLSFAVGAMFLMWLGEQITEKGIGNGISMLIFAGICASLPNVFGGLISGARTGDIQSGIVLGIVVLLLALFFFIVFIETSQRRVPIHYARQRAGMSQANSNASHLPMKINLAGVIPPIFASAIVILLKAIFDFVAKLPAVADLFDGRVGLYASSISSTLTPGQPFYIVVFSIMIIGFSFFYTNLVFENKELADDLKRSGAFIQGVRPGKQTADYLDLVQTRLTLIGALYLTLVVILPEVFNLNSSNQVLLMFGGTSILIIVVVAIDFVNQVQSYRMEKQYSSMMKKSQIGRKRQRRT